MVPPTWLFALTLAGQSAAAAERPLEAPPLLTLADAMEQALVRNDRLAAVRDGIEQADLAERLARSAFRPKLVPNIQGSFGQTDVANQTYSLDLTQRFPTGTEIRSRLGTTSARNQIGTYYNTDTTVQLTQPLLRGFGGGSPGRQIESARARRAAAGREQTLSQQQVAVEVASAYYRIVAQERLSGAAEQSIERARTLLDASQAKLEVGRVSQLDVFRARQLVAQAEVQVLDSRAALEDAREQLRILMGREGDYEFEVAADIPREVEAIGPDQAVETALANRLELRNARDLQAEGERAVGYSRNQLLPQVDVSVALTRREVAQSFSSSFRFDSFRFATFFTVGMPVDRTPQSVEYYGALLERDRRRRDTKATERRVAEEARRVVRHQERLAKAVEVTEANLDFARKELEVAELRYQRGLSNNLDVVNAEGNVLAAEGRHISTLAELAVVRLSLRAVLGILDPRADLKASVARAARTDTAADGALADPALSVAADAASNQIEADGRTLKP